MLTEEKIALLRLARASLSHWLENSRPLPADDEEGYAVGEECRLATNVFVSVHVQDKLRGCIGTVQADKPLYRSVAESAISAGAHDARFKSIAIKELADCDFEISVLGDFERIGSAGALNLSPDFPRSKRGVSHVR